MESEPSALQLLLNTFDSKFKRHKCVLCDASYDNLKDLQIHTYVHVPAGAEDDLSDTEYEVEPDTKVIPIEYEEKLITGGETGKVEKIPVPLSAVMPVMSHECVLCHAAFDRLDKLQAHSYEHLPPNSEDFNYEDDYVGLVDTTTAKTNQHTCVLCSASFGDIEDLRAHSYEHLPQSLKRPRCDECGATFSCSTNLSRHKHLHREKAHKCKFCNAAFALRFKLTKHMAVHNAGQAYICDDCGEAFAHKSTLKVHMSRRHFERRFKCEECDGMFVTNNDLQKHKEILHAIKIKIYKCKMCHFRFSSKDELAAHKPVHILPPIAEVSPSEESNSTSPHHDKLVKHEPNHDKACIRNNVETCCGISFESFQDLAQHKRLHTTKKVYDCKECGASFQQLSYLTIHARIHAGQKPFKCKLCSCGFTHSGALKRHLQSHNTTCELCNDEFSDEAQLNTHLLIHLNNKPFKCTVCNKLFKSQFNLEYHMRTHK